MTRSSEQTVADAEQIDIRLADATIKGRCWQPPRQGGVVLFIHGSGSSHRSPRNEHVARALHQRGHAAVLFDLLTDEEAGVDHQSGQYRFDVDFLTGRVLACTEWVQQQAWCGGRPLGYFGAGTGAAVAIAAAGRRSDLVKSVVSRGGRIQLAEAVLRRVKAPTLLIVGEKEKHILKLNREALSGFQSEAHLEVIDGAGHLFEENDALDRVAALAGDWFDRYLSTPSA